MGLGWSDFSFSPHAWPESSSVMPGNWTTTEPIHLMFVAMRNEFLKRGFCNLKEKKILKLNASMMGLSISLSQIQVFAKIMDYMIHRNSN